MTKIKEKQIQISESLFSLMTTFCLLEDFRTEENYQTIKKGIYDKIDRMQDHELYTKYKCAPTPEQKEKARQEYLERKGIPKNFRW